MPDIQKLLPSFSRKAEWKMFLLVSHFHLKVEIEKVESFQSKKL